MEAFLHVGGKDPGSGFSEVNLHDAKTRSMTRCMVQIYARGNLQEISGKGLPVQVEAHIRRQVNSNVGLVRDAEESMLEFKLMDVNWNIGPDEVF